MPRLARILVKNEMAVYHVISRTALEGLPFDASDKDHFVKLLKHYSRIYFTELLGFAVMDNHFHLLIRMHTEDEFSDEEIRKRYGLCYGEERFFDDEIIPRLREKWGNLSEFVKDLKQTFTRYFNRKKGRRGTLWAERYKSVLLENGETLVNCLAYIDLNPVRAGIVKRPEHYRWNSLGYHVRKANGNGFLSLDLGLKEFGERTYPERVEAYRRYVYETGAVEKGCKSRVDEKLVEKERKKNYRITRTDRFITRTRYFTESVIIGSQEFVQTQYQMFRGVIGGQKEKTPKKVSGLPGVYSLRELRS